MASCGGGMRRHHGRVGSCGRPVSMCHGGKEWWERMVVVGLFHMVVMS